MEDYNLEKRTKRLLPIGNFLPQNKKGKNEAENYQEVLKGEIDLKIEFTKFFWQKRHFKIDLKQYTKKSKRIIRGENERKTTNSPSWPS